MRTPTLDEWIGIRSVYESKAPSLSRGRPRRGRRPVVRAGEDARLHMMALFREDRGNGMATVLFRLNMLAGPGHHRLWTAPSTACMRRRAPDRHGYSREEV